MPWVEQGGAAAAAVPVQPHREVVQQEEARVVELGQEQLPRDIWASGSPALAGPAVAKSLQRTG